MIRTGSTALTALILTLGLAGCQPGDNARTGGSQDDAATDAPANDAATDAAGPAPPPMDAQEEARVRAALAARVTEIEAATERLPGLIASIRADMRRNLNAEHVAAARRNGVGPVRDDAHVEALLESGQLVRLPDSTTWWVLRDLNQSLPYVTPGTLAALEEIGRRFHARLDERGIPPFRLDVTSVLRTGEQQAALRRRNRNASRTTSSHEFGTTLDIAYLSFAAPAELGHPTLNTSGDASGGQPEAGRGAGPLPGTRLPAALRADLMTQLDTLATRHAPHIEGELGAVLQQLQRDGTVLPLRERSQPVFHITVARDLP